MKLEIKEDNHIPFRLMPVLRWVNAPNDARQACGIGPFDKAEMLQFGWLHFEIDLGVFRVPR